MFDLAPLHLLGPFRITDGASTVSMAQSHLNECRYLNFNQAL
jgi:hypothetical protein